MKSMRLIGVSEVVGLRILPSTLTFQLSFHAASVFVHEVVIKQTNLDYVTWYDD